jgi:hypothetical protein
MSAMDGIHCVLSIHGDVTNPVAGKISTQQLSIDCVVFDNQALHRALLFLAGDLEFPTLR